MVSIPSTKLLLFDETRAYCCPPQVICRTPLSELNPCVNFSAMEKMNDSFYCFTIFSDECCFRLIICDSNFCQLCFSRGVSLRYIPSKHDSKFLPLHRCIFHSGTYQLVPARDSVTQSQLSYYDIVSPAHSYT